MSTIVEINFDGFAYHHSRDDYPDKSTFNLHCHNQYEIYFFIQGEGCFLIEGNRYDLKKYSMLLMRPGEFHFFNIINPCLYERHALHFSGDFLPCSDSRDILLSPFTEHDLGKNNLLTLDIAEAESVLNIFQRLDGCAALPHDEKLLKSRFILGELLTTILGISRHSGTSELETTNEIINNILKYINSNVTSNFTLDDLSSMFFISKYHLSRTFKKYTGVSVYEYILRKKVLAAEQMIKSGKKPSEAAGLCNFGDYSSFYRSYKRITGTSPTGK